MGYYGRGAAPSVKRDFLPGHNEDPRGREGCHVLEVLPDVLGGSGQDGRVHGLSVVDLASDPVVHVCPKWGDEGPPVRQGEGLGRELAHQHVEGDNAVVIDLKGKTGFAWWIRNHDNSRVLTHIDLRLVGEWKPRSRSQNPQRGSARRLVHF